MNGVNTYSGLDYSSEGAELELVGIQRALAYQIDDAAGVAGATEQRAAAAQQRFVQRQMCGMFAAETE